MNTFERVRGASPIIAALGVGAVMFTLTHKGGDVNPKDGAIIACTGEQTVSVHTGDTITSLLENHVETPSADHLKTSANLSKIATSLAFGRSSDGNWYVPAHYGELSSPGLAHGSAVTLPEECHSVE